MADAADAVFGNSEAEPPLMAGGVWLDQIRAVDRAIVSSHFCS